MDKVIVYQTSLSAGSFWEASLFLFSFSYNLRTYYYSETRLWILKVFCAVQLIFFLGYLLLGIFLIPNSNRTEEKQNLINSGFVVIHNITLTIYSLIVNGRFQQLSFALKYWKWYFNIYRWNIILWASFAAISQYISKISSKYILFEAVFYTVCILSTLNTDYFLYRLVKKNSTELNDEKKLAKSTVVLKTLVLTINGSIIGVLLSIFMNTFLTLFYMEEWFMPWMAYAASFLSHTGEAAFFILQVVFQHGTAKLLNDKDLTGQSSLNHSSAL